MLLRGFSKNLLSGSRRRNIFSYIIYHILTWGLNYVLTSNKSTYYLLDYGDMFSRLDSRLISQHITYQTTALCSLGQAMLGQWTCACQLCSHTIHVVCVNFISEWWDLQYNVKTDFYIFFKKLFHVNFFFLLSEFFFCHKSAEKKSLFFHFDT